MINCWLMLLCCIFLFFQKESSAVSIDEQPSAVIQHSKHVCYFTCSMSAIVKTVIHTIAGFARSP